MCNTIKSEEDFFFWVDGVWTKKKSLIDFEYILFTEK